MNSDKISDPVAVAILPPQAAPEAQIEDGDEEQMTEMKIMQFLNYFSLKP